MTVSTTKLKLTQIRIDGGTQLRELSIDHVAELKRLAETALQNIPKAIVFHDGKDYWLADGFHRYHALRECGIAAMNVEVKTGTVRQAILYACGANSRHGLPRTNADKRRIVETLLKDKEWGGKSANWIAEKCNVSVNFAAEMKRALSSDDSRGKVVEGKDGRKIQVANIGRRKEIAAVPNTDKPTAAVTPPSTAELPKLSLPPKVVGAFRDRTLFDDTASLLAQVMKNLHAIAGDGGARVAGPAGLHMAHQLQKVETDISNIRNALRFTRPHQVCPYCQGKGHGCAPCKNQGWVCEQVWESAPKDLKSRIEAAFGGVK